jgi:hypothetical protein
MDNLYLNPVAQRVQDGTTFGGADMCASCRFAMKRIGSLTGFEETRCGAMNHTPIVPVKLSRCTAYCKKGQMTLGEMQDTAWVIEVRGKQIGFLSPEDLERRRQNQPCQTPAPHGF